MYTEMSACMFYRCFLSGVLVPLKPSKSQVVKAVCILLCQKYPEAQITFGAGKTSLSSILVGRSFHVEGQWQAVLAES